MRPRSKHVLVALLATFCLAFAYAPLLSAGLLATDIAVLVERSAEIGLGPFAADGLAKPLTRLSLDASIALWGMPFAIDDQAVAFAFRAENLAFHLIGAVALGFFTRRLLLPWLGGDQSRAAGQVAALLAALHPLAVAAVADLGARGDLIGAALGATSAAAFLRGRQDRRAASMIVALLCAVLAGFASDVALGIPPLFFVAELASSHRYRPWRVRVRTALTTMVVFGAAASIDVVVHVARFGSDGLPPAVRAIGSLGASGGASAALTSVAEKLGVLVLPSNPEVEGIAGIAVAGALFLLAMQSALVAARSAPRLWGWLLSTWFAALAVSAALHAHVEVPRFDMFLVRALFPSALVMSVGLAIGTTAVSGDRRRFIAWTVAIGYAVLAHGNALPWRVAAMEVADLRADLRAALDVHPARRVLVLDPPGPVQGVDPVGDALAFLAHPAVGGAYPTVEATSEAAGAERPDVRGVRVEAFLALLRLPEFDEFAADGVLVVVPREALGEAGQVGGTMRRPYRLLRPGGATAGTRNWSGLVSPQLDASSLREGALVARAPAGVDPVDLRELRWSARDAEAPDRGTVAGEWRRTGDGTTGVFDLSSSLAWRLGGRIRSISFPSGKQALASVALAAALPTLGEAGTLEPVTRGDDWLFPVPDPDLLAGYAEGRFVLTLLDVARLELTMVDVLVEPQSLRALGAAERARRIGSSASIAWFLEYRIGPHAVARSIGRR